MRSENKDSKINIPLSGNYPDKSDATKDIHLKLLDLSHITHPTEKRFLLPLFSIYTYFLSLQLNKYTKLQKPN